MAASKNDTKHPSKNDAKHPCRNCKYFTVCGDNQRTVECEGRELKGSKRKSRVWWG